MGVYKLNGGSPLEAWNALVEDVNDLVPECPGIEALELLECPELWSCDDIQMVQDKLLELCPDHEFEPIPEKWCKSKVDELIAAIQDPGTCCCEDEVIEFEIEPEKWFCPNRFFGGRNGVAFCIGKAIEDNYTPFEEKFWGGSLSIGLSHEFLNTQGLVNASVEFGIQIPIGCAGEILWQGDGFYVPFFTNVIIPSNPGVQDAGTIKLYLYCPFSTSTDGPNEFQFARWGGDFFINFGDEADQCCAAYFGACNQTCPFPCTRNNCDKSVAPDPDFAENNCDDV